MAKLKLKLQQQLYLQGENIEKDKVITNNNNIPSYLKADKIKEHLKEWNTIPDVELYKDLYDICSQLFLLTYYNKLQDVSYYIDTEYHNGKKIKVMYAEINNTWNLELKERYNLHKNLIERVKSNDLTLKFCKNININADINYYDNDNDNEGQLSLFL